MILLRLILPLFLVLVVGCSPSGSTESGPPVEPIDAPVLVVGMDGMDWSVLEPLMEEGLAPHFKALVERGVGGSLATMLPTFSPVVWTSIATGRTREEHGIQNFAVIDAQGRLGLPYTSNTRRVPAIWNMAGEHGRSVLSVAWWVSWPAEQVPHGRIVASYAAQVQGRILWKPGVWEHGLPELTWPPELQESLLPLFADGRPGGPVERQFVADFGKLPHTPAWKFAFDRDVLFRVAYRGDATHVAVTRKELSAGASELNMVYIGLPDVAGHFFWRYHQPGAFHYQVPPDRVARLHDRIRKTYEVCDRWLGELVAAAPKDARIMVLSDHGMHAANLDDPRNIQSGAHEDAPDGILILAGPDIATRGMLPHGTRRLGGILDITPTLLDWLGLSPAQHAHGHSLRRFMSAAWRADHPVLPPFDYAAGFRPPTPPRVPTPDANREFQESLIEGLGYAGGDDTDQ